MRQNVQAARDRGIHLGFFSANTCYWQVRFEASPATGAADRTMVCYKDDNTLDPFRATDPQRVTTKWRSSPVNLPEDALLGVMYDYDPVNNADLVIDNASHWVFEGTGLKKGDHLPGLVGYEADRIFAGGPANLVRLAHSPVLVNGTPGFSDMSIYTAPSGAIVFAAGTIQWSWGLDGYNGGVGHPLFVNPAAQQMTRNLLARFAGTANKLDSVTSISPSHNPAALGQPVTLTAIVVGATGNAETPTGSVEFFDGAASLGTAGLSAGRATLATSALAAGSHAITAIYSGDAIFDASASSALSLMVSASGGTQQLLGNPGFENGSANPAPWAASAGVIDNSPNKASHSGAWKAWLNGYGAVHTDTVAQQVTIPAAAAATLSFWLRIDTTETTTTIVYDTLTVQLRDAAGATVLATLGSYTNLDAAAGYRQVSFDVSAYQGQTVQLYVKGTEDSVFGTSFLLDDFALSVPAPGGSDVTPPTASLNYPLGGATVSGAVTVLASASDDFAVAKLEVYVDGALKATSLNAASLSYLWDTAGLANGTHALAAKAYDAAGNVGASATVTVTTANADFSVTAAPAALSIARGGSGAATLTTTTVGSFNSALSLSVSGLPVGASASFSLTTIAAPGAGSAALAVAVNAAAAAGTYPLTVTATGGGKTRTASISLTVTDGGGATQQLLGNPGFEEGSASPAAWAASAGVIDNTTFRAAHAGTWKAWFDGYGSAHTDTLSQQVTIPVAAASAALSFWLHIDTAETTTTAANDTLLVQVRDASGATVLATLATYSNLDAAAGYRQVSFDVSAYQGQTVQLYLKGVENNSRQTSFVLDDFALTVVQ